MIFRYSEKKAKIFAIANSLFEKAKANQSERIENFRARSEANSLRFASLFAIANCALRIYMPGFSVFFSFNLKLLTLAVV